MAPPRYLLMVDIGSGGGRSVLETVWRLVGRNNRDLGRSAAAFPAESECLAAIEALQAGMDRAELALVGASDRDWRWVLRLDGVPVAVSSRAYQRQRECEYNAHQFLAAAIDAKPAKRLRVARRRSSLDAWFADEQARAAL